MLAVSTSARMAGKLVAALVAGLILAVAMPITAQEPPANPTDEPANAAGNANAAADPFAGRAFVEAAIAEVNLTAHYDWLRKTLVDYRDFFKARFPAEHGGAKLPGVVERVFADPLAQIGETQTLTDPIFAAGETDDVAAMLTAIGAALDLPATALDLRPEEIIVSPPAGAALDDYLNCCEWRLEAAARRIESAFDKLTPEERRSLFTVAPQLFDELRQTVYLEFVDEPRRGRLLEFIALATRVNVADLLVAEKILASLADIEFLAQMAADVGTLAVDPTAHHEVVSGGVVAVRNTRVGPIIVGGTGPNEYAGPAALILDLGGNDFYGPEVGAVGTREWPRTPAPQTAPQTVPAKPLRAGTVAVVLDLAGDDRYVSDLRPGIASAIGGAALVADLAGDDHYQSGMNGQGVGVYGAGLLLDFAGNDKYIGDCFGQGMGAWGVGLIYDRAGDDDYTGGAYAMAVGLPGGVGAVFDRLGTDTMRASGEFADPQVPSSYGTEGQFHGMTLGCGFGFRAYPGRGFHEIAAGGIGMLLSGAGDDRFIGGEFSMAIGYFFGLGIFREHAGNDTYEACRYGIATGAHQAQSCFIDDAGNDTYRNISVAAMAGNWDTMICTLYDGAGDDVYDARAGLALGAATITSFAMLFDAAGADRYQAASAETIGNGGHSRDFQRETMSLGIFIDRGSDPDTYARPETADSQPRADGLRNLDVRKQEDKIIGTGLFVDEGPSD